MSTPISKEAEEYWKRLEATGMAYEFTAETICLRAFQDGRDSVSHPPALQWTAERPKVAGWYWCRDVKWPHLKEVRYIEPLALVANQWHEYAGPLPLPSEPQAKET